MILFLLFIVLNVVLHSRVLSLHSQTTIGTHKQGLSRFLPPRGSCSLLSDSTGPQGQDYIPPGLLPGRLSTKSHSHPPLLHLVSKSEVKQDPIQICRWRTFMFVIYEWIDLLGMIRVTSVYLVSLLIFLVCFVSHFRGSTMYILLCVSFT